jgi:hypothetical protein
MDVAEWLRSPGLERRKILRIKPLSRKYKACFKDFDFERRHALWRSAGIP